MRWVLDKLLTIVGAALLVYALDAWRTWRKQRNERTAALQRLAREIEILRKEVFRLGQRMKSPEGADGPMVLEVQQDHPGYDDLRQLAEQLKDPGHERLLRDWYSEVARTLAFAFDYVRGTAVDSMNWGISMEEWERRGKDLPDNLINLSKGGEPFRDGILEAIGLPPGHDSAMGHLAGSDGRRRAPTAHS